MDRVRDYLDRLEIQDPRHELAKNPTVVPSDWDRNKFRPVVRGLNGTEITSSRAFSGRHPPSPAPPVTKPLRRYALPRETFDFSPDTESSALSRASSSSTYSSVFSEGGRSTSTAPSLYNPSYKDTPEEFEDHAPTIHVCSESQPPRRFGRVRGVGRARLPIQWEFSRADALFEEDVVIKENREVIITKPNPQRASLDEREVPYERGQCIIHDLKAEERHQKKEKQRKEQLHEAEQAEELEKKRQADAAMHEWLMEFRSISHTTDTSSNSGPDTNQADGTLTAQMIEVCSHKLSQIFSQTDSGISEDATDWEEDSDDDSFLPHDHEEKLELESSFVQNYLTPMKLQAVERLIERLMADFWNIFNDRWSVGIRQLGSTTDGSNQSTASTTSESRSSSRCSSRAWGGKRSRSDDREDDDVGDRPGRRRKPQGKLPAVQEVEGDVERQFACPFRKRDPWKYSVKEWPRCALKPQKTIARLKAHLYQYHILHQCLRCKAVFDSEELLDAHTIADERCNVNAEEPVDGMTRKMKDQIQCRKKLHPGQTEAEKWEAIYRILFPDEVVPDPYFEPVPDHDIQGQRRQSSDSVNLSEYEAYLRRVLPRFVRNVLEEVVSGELEPIETQLQSRMMETLQEATNQAFLSFRNMRRSDSQVRSTPGLDTAMTATSSTHQHTRTETFFELPPPVNFSRNELYLAQPNPRYNSPSDSGYASRPSLSNSSNYTSSDKIEREVAFSSGVGEEQLQSGPKNTPTFDFSQFCDLGEVVESGMDLPEDTYQPENTFSSVPAPPSIHTSTQNQEIEDDLFLGDLRFENTKCEEMTDLDFDTSMDVWE